MSELAETPFYEAVPIRMRRSPICTYCEEQATTADHVPPRLLFAKPRPELITVPSCRSCNQRASLDDEYFRAVTAFHDKAAEHPEAKRVLDAVLRSLQRPRKKGFRRAFLSTIRAVDRLSPSGLYLGKVGSYGVDLRRLTRVIERITRGLFLHHIGHRLPLDCELQAYSASGFSAADLGTRKTLLSLVEQTRVTPLRSIGDEVFCYRYAIASDQENSSVWVFVVYRAISFISITIDVTHALSSETDA